MGTVIDIASLGEKPAQTSGGCATSDLREIDRDRRKHFEVFTTGVDEFLQMQGGDPWGGISSSGLRVPFLATPAVGAGGGAFFSLNPTSALDLRYLFMLCSFSIGYGARARIRGFRQLLTIGAKITPTPFVAGAV